MNNLIDTIMIVLVLTNLVMLGTSRLRTCIELIAIQGIVLGALPLLVHRQALGIEPIIFSTITIALKGIVFPWVLMRALSQVNARRGRTLYRIWRIAGAGTFGTRKLPVDQ
jgi:hydrogenase-4 component E